jgi:hypothetical protein
MDADSVSIPEQVLSFDAAAVPASVETDSVYLGYTESSAEQVLSFAAAAVPASVDKASVDAGWLEVEVDYDDALMGDEGAHLKRDFDEIAPVDRPQKKMSPAKQGPAFTTTIEDQGESVLQMLMAAERQVWEEDQRAVETQHSPHVYHDAFNASAFGTIEGEGEEEEDEDL